ncbi:MAG TPA: outer membrane beta-barrel protein [Ferruginibacter sp.]|nr:outer membrane beta-barrel protein [Ferruginibacter sp.]
MKKTILLISLLLAFASTRACDICGCGVGTQYIGILPDFRKQIIGLRYRYSKLWSHLGIGGANTYLTTAEQYSSVELWTGWNIGKKFRVMASVPWQSITRTNQGVSLSKQGVGDATLWGFYNLLNKRSTLSNRLLMQSLWIGTGLKLPTGRYIATDKSSTGTNSNLFQLGTGSVDVLTSLMYDIRLQDFGLNVNAQYRFNGQNKSDYTYGNKISLNSQLYYKWKLTPQLTVAPNAGWMYESSKYDLDNKLKVDLSGGNLTAVSFGAEFSFNRITLGGNWQHPLWQQMANGIIKAGNKGMLHIGYTF